MARSLARRTTRRTAAAAVIGSALLAVTASSVAAAPHASSGSGAARVQQVTQLNDYCEVPGAVAHLADGRTVYCVRVERTDAYVWSYQRGNLTHDPNQRGYSCGDNGCRFPDGSEVPGYQRCGILCGEPPTSGDVQSGLAECFESGEDFEVCEGRIR
ncbi:hypothetical protein ACTD5D_34985 [Nocardia takedensis]|uniref:hypothetical protein n=1 Tax=Nocardia takedensis TaxID=259390 RepID=UPI0012F6CC1C|nr:hypothetical protein [Nocardia takedensis]